MALWTTYLAYLTKLRREKGLLLFSAEEILEKKGLTKPKIYYVMRNRGNNDVAPTQHLLNLAKSGKINWTEYRHRYLDWIHTSFGLSWIKRIGEIAEKQDVVLVCFEKDAEHCHRTLLAQVIAKWTDAEFKGELSQLFEER